MAEVSTRKIEAPILIHPEVVFSVWDHINRACSQKKILTRNIGALMGCYNGNSLEITSSFAIPYDEDKEDPLIWYIDMDYVKLFSEKLNRLNPKYHLVGWYHDGDQILSTDVNIHSVFSDMIDTPVLIIFDFNKENSLPIKGYLAAEKVTSDGTTAKRGFDYLKCEYIYDSAEEMTVSQLKRNIQKSNVGILTSFINEQFGALNNLTASLEIVVTYLTQIIEKKIPINNQILFQVQNLMNKLFIVNSYDISKISNLHHNDHLVVTYMAVLCRNIILLNELLNNRLLHLKKCEDRAQNFFDKKVIK